MSSSSTATLVQTCNFTTCFTCTSVRTWVIDSEASNYVTRNKGILSTLNSLSSLLPVTLVDGSASYTGGVATANATLYLSLSCVLYIPKFSFNLLSVSKLTRSLNFFFDLCLSGAWDRGWLAQFMSLEAFITLWWILLWYLASVLCYIWLFIVV